MACPRGADDYVVKRFALRELELRLRALLMRAPGPTSALQLANVRIDPHRRTASMDGQPLELTRRDFDLLEVLARNSGLVLSRSRLLELVWGYDFDVRTDVVDTFVSYLRRKLEAGGRPRLIHTVRGVGFVLRPRPEAPSATMGGIVLDSKELSTDGCRPARTSGDRLRG